MCRCNYTLPQSSGIFNTLLYLLYHTYHKMNGLHVLPGNSLQMCYIYIPVNNQLIMLRFLTQVLSNKINNATQNNIL